MLEYQSLQEDYNGLKSIYDQALKSNEALKKDIEKLNTKIEAEESNISLLKQENLTLKDQKSEYEYQMKGNNYFKENATININRYKSFISKHQREHSTNLNKIYFIIYLCSKMLLEAYISVSTESKKLTSQYKEVFDLYQKKNDMSSLKSEIENDIHDVCSQILNLKKDKIIIILHSALLKKNQKSSIFFNDKLEKEINDKLNEGDKKIGILSLIEKKKNQTLKIQFTGEPFQILKDVSALNTPLFSIECFHCHNKNLIFPKDLNKKALELIPEFTKLNTLFMKSQFENNDRILKIKQYKKHIVELIKIITAFENEKKTILDKEKLNRNKNLNSEDDFENLNFGMEFMKDFQSNLKDEVNEKILNCNESTRSILEPLFKKKIEEEI